MPKSSKSGASSSMESSAFLTHHALRIKGFARIDALVEMTDIESSVVDSHLRRMADVEWAMFREARSLWQLTPQGREAHRQELAIDVVNYDLVALGPHYATFLGLNEAFKNLCGEWQLRGGEPNDHADPKYDRDVIGRLADLHADARPVLSEMTSVVPRLRTYSPRLSDTCRQVQEGIHQMFTGVMCGSFHDVWMELHEDLILTQGIDRAAEGSF